MSRRNIKNKYPVLENVPVVDAGAKGKSIAKADSLVVLVENAIPGDVIDIQITKKKKGLAEGRPIAFHKYSPDRLVAVCPHFEVCGGCKWQNMTYAAQLRFKEKMVRDTLTRIGKLEIPEMQPIEGSARTEYYRNRLDFAFSNKKWLTYEQINDPEFTDKFQPGLGFHISGSFDKVLDISRCYLQPDPSNQIRLAVREFAIKNNYPFYNLKHQDGLLRSLIIRTTTTGELMVLIIFYKNDKKKIDDLMNYVLERFPSITSFYYVINPKANDTVYDLEHFLYHGREYIIENILGINYRIGPKSFFQTNPFQTPTLFSNAIDMAGLTGNEIVYDLYTGVGSIALQVANKAKKVIGIETVSEAIDFAKHNAADNNITNAEFFAGDVKDIFTDEFIGTHGKPDVIITDPPRVGMDPPVVNKILELCASKVVYVSCNPATQARDLEMLSSAYKIVKVQPVDMFPHTFHVENIVLLEKKQD